MAKITGPGPSELKVLAAKIRAADPALKRQLRAHMRSAAGPVITKVQESILSMPSHHGGEFRRQVAGTVTSRVSFLASGVRLDILSYGSKMPAGMSELPAELDSAKGWGHPVFGGKNKKRSEWSWVRQHGKPGWFENTISGEARQLQNSVQAAMDDTARSVEH